MVAVSSLLQTVLGLETVAKGSTNLTELFGPSLSAEAKIILPSENDFHSKLTQRWTDYNAPSYTGAIKPATDTDIQNIVSIANAHNISFFTTGGGHGISDYHSFKGLSIDLSGFNSVHMDADAGLLTIGGSTRIHQIVKPLYAAGKELPLGSCECVGVVGATLGGGIGSLHGHRGTMADALESVRLITANGDLIEASEKQNPDLFWGLRGAGSNFGIVTSATYKVHDSSNHGWYMNADFVYPASANGSFWQVMKSYDDTLPSRLAITAVAFFNRITNEPVIAVNAVFFGPKEEGEPHLEPFRRLGPVQSNITMVPQDGYMDAAFFNFFGQDNGACTPNQHINIYTVALKQIHPPTFETFFADLTKFWVKYEDFQGRLLMQRYPTQGPQATPDGAMAYGLRDVKTFMNIEGFYSDTGIDGAVNSFVTPWRAEFARTSGFERLTAYSNYARGDEGPESWYTARKLPRLAELKRKWDPRQRFSHNNPVPLHWSPDTGNDL